MIPFEDAVEQCRTGTDASTGVQFPKSVPPIEKFAVQYAPAHFFRACLTVDRTELDNNISSPNRTELRTVTLRFSLDLRSCTYSSRRATALKKWEDMWTLKARSRPMSHPSPY